MPARPCHRIVEKVVDYLKEEALCGGYETEAKYKDEIEAVYGKIAQLIGSSADEIALLENASAAWGTAFKGISFSKGDEILTTEMEYVTNLIGIADIQKSDVKVIVIANDADGNFDVSKLEQAITPKTRLIMVTHISSSGGSIMPVKDIGAIAAKYNILYLLDACQSVGHLEIDVKEINCDLLSATGRKYLRAPRGTGFLFVKRKILDEIHPVLMDFQSVNNVSLKGYTLRDGARRFELYEKNRALTLGLGKAVDYALHIGTQRISDRIKELSSYLRGNLSEIPNVQLHDSGNNLSGIVTFSLKNMDSNLVKSKLAENRINVSVAGAQATPLYMENQKLELMLRA